MNPCSQSAAAGSGNDSDQKDAHMSPFPPNGTSAFLRMSLEQTVKGQAIFSRFGAF